ALDLGVQAVARIILAAQADSAALGAYAAGFGLARPLDLVFIGVSAAFAPHVFAAFEQSVEEARAVARNAFAMLAAITLPVCVGLALVAEPLTTLMIGESLRAEAARALPWLALAGLFSGFSLYYWSEAFQLSGRTGLRALLMLAPASVQLGATLFLAPTYGAQGAAMAAATGAVVGCGLLAVVGRGLIALPAPLADLLRPLAATAVMAGGILSLPGDAGLFARVAFGAMLYVVAATALDVLGVRARASAVWQALARKLRASRSHLLHGSK
ncbi:MAG: polysaccharide biosynthesis C-terminal domain-containing protein, partial [Phycisphaerales bacterium]|nr:polysaccharide biosynthesis C-terminal domain-containing protein [Hyphomonadaceae bacterium]